MNKAYLFYLLRRGIIGGRGSSPWVKIVNDFKERVEGDGGTLESTACLNTDVKYLTENPIAPSFTGLLNDYSGAAAAYSLRLLDNTYSGHAVRVRRASDNTEQDIGFANNELDTTSLETFCSGTDGFVTTWYDQSGNAVNAANATAAEQPKIVASGSTILENGKAAVRFDGSNDKLKFPQVITGTTARSFFITNKVDISGGAEFGCLISLDVASSGSGTSYRISRETAEIRLRVSGSSAFNYPSGTTALDYNLLTNIWTNGGSQDAKFWSNSVSAPYSTGTSSNLNTSIITGFHYMGWSNVGSNTLDGNIQEMVIYASDQSTNRSGIETNINDHYSIY